jgi:hypothetical protein
MSSTTTTSNSFVNEHRGLLPFETYIPTSGESGALGVTDIFIHPDKKDELVRIVSPVAAEMRKIPEFRFVEMAQNPQDPGHFRYLHGWTKGSEWFREVCDLVGVNLLGRVMLDFRFGFRIGSELTV